MQIFRRKAITPKAESSESNGLPKTLGTWELTTLGVGAIIGTGIFVLTGIAAARYAGPGVVLSFIFSGTAAILAALVYAEMASAVPLAGSAYTYAYVTLGELVAWLVGWNLVLEYAVAAGAVAVGWSAYFSSLMTAGGVHLPAGFINSPLQGGYINLPAFLIPLAITALLIRGIQSGALFNSLIVVIKLLVIGIFLFVGVTRVNPANWTPFLPFGLSGALKGAAIVFFAYIGFDAISTAAEEVKDPQRSLPRGILLALGLSTGLYIFVSLVLTGLVPYPSLNNAAPVAQALLLAGVRWGSLLVSVGAVAGLASVLFATIFAQSRIFFAMSRDGLIPPLLARIHPKYQSPYVITALIGLFVSLIGGFVPIGLIAELANIGTLTAFFTTSITVLLLERMIPKEQLSFRVPFSPYLPIASAAMSLLLAVNLPPVTWIRFIVWIGIGLLIYWLYGYRHSHLHEQAEQFYPAPALKKLPPGQEKE